MESGKVVVRAAGGPNEASVAVRRTGNSAAVSVGMPGAVPTRLRLADACCPAGDSPVGTLAQVAEVVTVDDDVSCIVLAATLGGRPIATIEGLAEGGDELLESFTEHGAAQCGFCAPGMIVAARAHLSEPRERGDERDAARDALAGNVCRCTGYTCIVDTVASCPAAEEGTPCAK